MKLSTLGNRLNILQKGNSLPAPSPQDLQSQQLLRKHYSTPPPTTVPAFVPSNNKPKQLNKHALEFKPLSPIQSLTGSIQNRLKINQGVPITEPEPVPVQPEPELFLEPAYIPTEEEVAVDIIENMANLLAEDPGNFDDFSERIENIFKDFYCSDYVLSVSMEMIFKKSTENSNFRYMGAKLFNLLDKLQAREHSLFRNLLHLKLSFLETEFQEQIESDNLEVLCGTLLFLSELYMQLKLDAIGNSIISGIDALLSILPKSRISKDNIKSICFTLKLSGFDLEKSFPDRMSEIIMKLKSFTGQNPTITVLVENILILQKSKWGRRDSVASNTSNGFGDIPQSGGQSNNEPTFYGPDGKALTEEESQFLNSQHDNDSDYEFDGMGQEEGMDFRKFLHSTK